MTVCKDDCMRIPVLYTYYRVHTNTYIHDIIHVCVPGTVPGYSIMRLLREDTSEKNENYNYYSYIIHTYIIHYTLMRIYDLPVLYGTAREREKNKMTK